MAQNSTGHGRAAIPLVLNKIQKKRFPSWDERFKELVDFKKINGHSNVSYRTAPLGRWVSDQRRHYRSMKKGKHSPFTIDKREKLERIGFEFNCRAPLLSWNQSFQELVDYKKINGHTNVPTCSGQLGGWVSYQRRGSRSLKEGNDSSLTIYKREKLESIGFEFKKRATFFLSWDKHFQELMHFKKMNGHANVPTRAGALGRWIGYQRKQYGLLKEGKDSLLTIDNCEKLESIGFEFDRRPGNNNHHR
eukprot:scaffold51595_cov58-Attheya_sp.AAC.1